MKTAVVGSWSGDIVDKRADQENNIQQSTTTEGCH
jgi:hypothetical protein